MCRNSNLEAFPSPSVIFDFWPDCIDFPTIYPKNSDLSENKKKQITPRFPMLNYSCKNCNLESFLGPSNVFLILAGLPGCSCDLPQKKAKNTHHDIRCLILSVKRTIWKVFRAPTFSFNFDRIAWIFP